MFLHNNCLHELNDSNRRIVGVFPSSRSGFPSIYYEDNFSEIKTMATSRKVREEYSNDKILSSVEKKYSGGLK